MQYNDKMIEYYFQYSGRVLNPEDQYFRLPRKNSKYKVKQIEGVPGGDEFIRVRGLFLNHYVDYVNIIPITDYMDNIHGFIYQVPEGDTRFIKEPFVDIFFYGWDTFKNFSYDKPLILVEGIKDCEAVQQVYPYCLAILTSYPGTKNIAFLKYLSSRIIMISDNDSTGRKMRIFCKRDGIEHYICPEKDPGVYFENNDYSELELFINGII